MKTYVIDSNFEFMFYPPLTKDEKIGLHEYFVSRPLREQASNSNGELLVKEELNLVGSVIAEASDEMAKKLRSLGFRLRIKKNA